MSTFKDRLLEEKQQLDDRAGKLDAFINGDKFHTVSDIQKSLLSIQLAAMLTYSHCLGERLAWLQKEEGAPASQSATS